MRQVMNMMRRFGRDDQGSLVAEAVMVLPFMLWAYIALFVYWDAFRSINTVQKAAYTISDMISREQLTITPAYIAGMDRIMERLVDEDQDVSLRVTSIVFDEADDRNEVMWSLSPGNALTPLTTSALRDLASQIPEMADGDSVVIVEVQVDYVPTFNVGVSDMTLSQFIVTRPRFFPFICMQGYACS